MEEITSLILEYITEQAMILVPVLWVVGMAFKKLETIKDKYIPIGLLVIGIALSNFYLGFSVESSLQGILATGLAVFAHQIKRQAEKDE